MPLGMSKHTKDQLNAPRSTPPTCPTPPPATLICPTLPLIPLHPFPFGNDGNGIADNFIGS